MPLPSLCEIFGASTEPTTPPAAPAIMRNANVVAVTFNTSWAKSTMVAATTEKSPLSRPRMIAIGRSNGLAHNHLTPSLISAQKPGRAPPFSDAGWTTLKEPLIANIRAAEMAKVPASKKNGRANAMPIRMLPRGGPMNWFITISAPQRRLFAFSRPSGSTIAGRIVWAALS